MDEWIKKMWYIYTTGYDPAIKRNEIGSFAVMWINLGSVFPISLTYSSLLVASHQQLKWLNLTHVKKAKFSGLHIYFSCNFLVHCRYSQDSLTSYIFHLYFLLLLSQRQIFCPAALLNCSSKDTHDVLVTNPVENFQFFLLLDIPVAWDIIDLS